MGRDWKPYPIFHLTTTVGRRSTRCTGRTRATARRCVLGLEISPGRCSWMHVRGRELNRDDARHLVGARTWKDAALRPLKGGTSTQRWVHTPARGSRRHRRPIFPSSCWVARRPLASLAHCGIEERRERREWARVWEQESGVGFVHPRPSHVHQFQMNGCHWSDQGMTRWVRHVFPAQAKLMARCARKGRGLNFASWFHPETVKKMFFSFLFSRFVICKYTLLNPFD
jgi:hypothetical protein